MRGSEQRKESRKVCRAWSEPRPVLATPTAPASSSLTFEECLADKSRQISSWLINAVVAVVCIAFFYFLSFGHLDHA